MSTPETTEKPEPKRYKIATAVLAGVILLYIAFHFLGLRITSSEGSESGNPNFPAGGPAEFMYLDSGRVASYLAQVNGGSFDAEKVTRKLTDTLSAKLAVTSAGEAGGSLARESFVERVLKPTDASSFFALQAGLKEQGQLEGIRLRYFNEDVEGLNQGQFVSFKTTALLSPLYLNSYLAVRQASTLKAMFPNSAARRSAARKFFEELGTSPRVVFALQPTDPTEPEGERKPFVYLLPMSARALTRERSLLKYGGGQFTVVGKVVRIFPEKRRDHRPAYIDSPTLETWEQPLRRAPGELLCRTDPRCIKRVREDRLEGRARKVAIEAARERALEALEEQTVIERRGAVILPVAIYK